MRVLAIALALVAGCHGQLVKVIAGRPHPAGGAALVTRALERYYEPALGDDGDSSKVSDELGSGYDYVLNNGAAFDSLGVSFDGVNDYAVADSAQDSGALSGNNGTIIFVAKLAAAEVSCVFWARKLSSPGYYASLNVSGFYGGGFPHTFTRFAVGTNDLRGQYVFLAYRTSPTDDQILENPTTLEASSTYGGTLDTVTEDEYIGASNQYQNYCEANIAGIYVYTDDLTDGEITQQYDYVKATYPAGITGDLP